MTSRSCRRSHRIDSCFSRAVFSSNSFVVMVILLWSSLRRPGGFGETPPPPKGLGSPPGPEPHRPGLPPPGPPPGPEPPPEPPPPRPSPPPGCLKGSLLSPPPCLNPGGGDIVNICGPAPSGAPAAGGAAAERCQGSADILLHLHGHRPDTHGQVLTFWSSYNVVKASCMRWLSLCMPPRAAP